MLSLSSLSLSDDRISELPDSILLHILSFLPAKDAVYTVSFLSKRWIHLGPFLPSLIFIEPTIVRNPEPKFINDQNHHHGYNHHGYNHYGYNHGYNHHGFNQHAYGYGPAYVYGNAPAIIYENAPYVYPSAPTPSTNNWSALVDATLISYDFFYVQRFCIQCDYIPAYAGLPYNKRKRQLQVDSWVNYAVRRKSIKQLELLFNSNHDIDKMYSLPRVLFGDETLTSLSLRSCLFRDCVSAITWTSLKTLSMEDIIFTSYNSHILKKILVGCPVLECLKLVRCDGLDSLEIVSDALRVLVVDHCYHQLSYDTNPGMNFSNHGMNFRVSAPNLRVLVISGFMWYKVYTIDIGPCLAEATFKEEPIGMASQKHHIDPYMYDGNAYYAFNGIESAKSMAKEFLRSAQHVKKLSIGSWCLQVHMMESLPYSFWSCKSLTLNISLKHWELPGLAVLLQNCPKLESLTIMWTTKSNIVKDLPYATSESNAATFLAGGQYTCLEQQLKKVELLNLSPIPKGGTLVIEFLKFLLKRCRVLENLSITTNKHCQSEQGVALDMFKEKDTMFERCLYEMLSNYPRSSQNAVIQVN